MKKLVVIGLSLTALTLSACSTTSNLSPETRAYYAQTQTTLQKKPVSVVSTACLSKSNLGKDYIFFMQSEGVGKAIAQTLNNSLTAKNLTVSKVYTPLVCGQKTNEKLTRGRIKFTEKGKTEKITVTPITTTENELSDTANNAFYNLFQALNTIKPSNKSTTTPVALNLSTNSIATLKNTLETDKVFVSMVDGLKPSFASQMAVGIATVAVSGGTYAATPTTGSSYAVYLVDLNSNKVEWNKQGVTLGNVVFKLPSPEEYTLTPSMISPLYEQQ